MNWIDYLDLICLLRVAKPYANSFLFVLVVKRHSRNLAFRTVIYFVRSYCLRVSLTPDSCSLFLMNMRKFRSFIK